MQSVVLSGKVIVTILHFIEGNNVNDFVEKMSIFRSGTAI
jgi:hypothetical protein